MKMAYWTVKATDPVKHQQRVTIGMDYLARCESVVGTDTQGLEQ